MEDEISGRLPFCQNVVLQMFVLAASAAGTSGNHLGILAFSQDFCYWILDCYEVMEFLHWITILFPGGVKKESICFAPFCHHVNHHEQTISVNNDLM